VPSGEPVNLGIGPGQERLVTNMENNRIGGAIDRHKQPRRLLVWTTNGSTKSKMNSTTPIS
jgi:hypothetical protein